MHDSYTARRLLLGVLLALIGLNALLFATQSANPLIVADGWDAVDTLVRPAATGGFDAADLFQKRATNDHSQPLRKLILLFHYRYFGLDFSVETMIGLLFAFINLVLFWRFVFPPSDVVNSGPGVTPQLGFAALAAVYLSLNATVVFAWPLVTLNYTSHTFMLLFLWAIWRALGLAGRRTLAVAFASALVMDVVADDTGLVASIAAVLAVVVWGWRENAWRRAAMVAAVVVGAYAVYALGYRLLIPPPTHAPPGGMGHALGLLLSQAPDAWKWAVIPLSSSIVHRIHLQDWLNAGKGLQLALAAAVAIAHAWFWWRTFTSKRQSLACFVAVALMLVFYGLLTGILLTRVGARGGSDYLWQPRYAVIYQWNLLALLLMGIDRIQALRIPAAGKMSVRAGTAVFGAVAAGLLALQIPLAMSGWNHLRFMSAYQQRMAFQIGTLAAHPEQLPEKCMAQLVVCRFKPARRARLLQFLQQHRLNLFSPSFQARHRLYPNEAALPN